METAATPPPEMPRIQQLLQTHIDSRPILHLSFFDGIGAASQALRYLGANVVFTLSWETDEHCQKLLHQHFQSIQHGDVSSLSRQQLNDLIRHAAHGHDDLIILITTGPPCVDFSRLRTAPPGLHAWKDNKATSCPDRPRSSSALRKTGNTSTRLRTSWRTWFHMTK